MPHPLLVALWIIVRIAVIAVLIWAAYSLAQIHRALEQLKKPQFLSHYPVHSEARFPRGAGLSEARV